MLRMQIGLPAALIAMATAHEPDLTRSQYLALHGRPGYR